MEEERKTELHAVTSFVVALAILGGAVFGLMMLITHARKAEQEDTARALPSVEVITVGKRDHRVAIASQGVVESRRETKLAAEVGGRVTEISPNLKRGGTVKAGELLVKIDDADYQAALARAVAAREDAELALAQEEVRAEQAKLDWEKLGRGKASPLVLREPQLASIRARLESTRAEVERAERDVERTKVQAPFDARVRQAQVEVGAVLAPGGQVAELYSAEDLEVRLPISLEDFGFLDQDSRAGIRLRGTIGGEDLEWPAEVARIDGEVDRRTLSAYVTVKVLPGEGTRRLPPVGLFVYASVLGKEFKEVAEIPRTVLHGADEVIVVKPDNRIEFRKIGILRTTEDRVVVSSGLEDGERINATRLNAPVNGMEVRVEEKQDLPEH
ncbi:efflux RND transporter periplasmic adaptor subunit [Luteolibacter marinus]|uniref:efflux RND transporter periplasmic adaptor subunit n=1 Tax=Luteolibacter marinus TaxID=2776705 RepID=UPI001869412B|nr:efflux RND transporter periplasmic adaptor subunit [Luteolibacter marinus]